MNSQSHKKSNFGGLTHLQLDNYFIHFINHIVLYHQLSLPQEQRTMIRHYELEQETKSLHKYVLKIEHFSRGRQCNIHKYI